MSTEAFQRILRAIDKLGDEELLALEERLATRLQESWARETLVAREQARHRDIDQTTIDAAIERRRYGQ